MVSLPPTNVSTTSGATAAKRGTAKASYHQPPNVVLPRVEQKVSGTLPSATAERAVTGVGRRSDVSRCSRSL
jgi:hypothetical protein